MKILLISNNSEDIAGNIWQLVKRFLNDSTSNSLKITNNLFKENGEFRTIDSIEKYNSFDFSNFIPDIVFIVPELMWKNDGMNGGYKIATDLILHKYPKAFFQLIFLSVLNQEQILKKIEKRFEKIARAFIHHDLLEKNELINFTSYSKTHFELIKSLVISDSGRLDYIIHDFNAIKSNIFEIKTDDYIPYKEYLLLQLEELKLFQTEIIENDTETLTNLLSEADSIQKLQSVLPAFEDLIQKVNHHYFNNSPKASGKSNFRVLIIEDDPDYNQVLAAVFKELFSDVIIFDGIHSGLNIEKATEFVKENINEFDIVILDLLLKDNQGNWLAFNGLDLYKLIKEIKPYTAIRIVTNLPRDVISRIVNSTLKEIIPFGHIFTKSKGKTVLENSIKDRSDEIVLECIENERKRNMWKPFPKKGVFVWPTIPGLLFRLFYDLPKEYNYNVEKAFNFYNHYKNFGTLKNNPDWSGELLSSKMSKKITEDSFLLGLPVILTFRMLALDFYDKKNNRISIDFSKWKVILGDVSKREKFPIDYFNTLLGFVRTDIKKKLYPSSYELEITDLFPHERIIIYRLKDNLSTDEMLPETLKDWFFSIIILECTYDVWELLKLGYDPYNTEKIEDEEPIAENITKTQFSWNQLREFLESLMINYNAAPKQINCIIHQIENSSELIEDAQFQERFGDLIEELTVKRLK